MTLPAYFAVGARVRERASERLRREIARAEKNGQSLLNASYLVRSRAAPPPENSIRSRICVIDPRHNFARRTDIIIARN